MTAQPDRYVACPWCHELNPAGESDCQRCGHRADLPRASCDCPHCRRLRVAIAYDKDGSLGELPPLTRNHLQGALGIVRALLRQGIARGDRARVQELLGMSDALCELEAILARRGGDVLLVTRLTRSPSPIGGLFPICTN
jgi:hypothetical protein